MYIKQRKRPGFTLVETAAAMMVFSMLSLGVLLLQGSMSRSARTFLDSFESMVGMKNARVLLEREQRLIQKAKIEISNMPVLSYQMVTIPNNSALSPFAKESAIGLFEVVHQRGLVDRSIMMVPLPIEKKSQKAKGAEKQADGTVHQGTRLPRGVKNA